MRASRPAQPCPRPPPGPGPTGFATGWGQAGQTVPRARALSARGARDLDCRLPIEVWRLVLDRLRPGVGELCTLWQATSGVGPLAGAVAQDPAIALVVSPAERARAAAAGKPWLFYLCRRIANKPPALHQAFGQLWRRPAADLPGRYHAAWRDLDFACLVTAEASYLLAHAAEHLQSCCDEVTRTFGLVPAAEAKAGGRPQHTRDRASRVFYARHAAREGLFAKLFRLNDCLQGLRYLCQPNASLLPPAAPWVLLTTPQARDPRCRALLVACEPAIDGADDALGQMRRQRAAEPGVQCLGSLAIDPATDRLLPNGQPLAGSRDHTASVDRLSLHQSEKRSDEMNIKSVCVTFFTVHQLLPPG